LGIEGKRAKTAMARSLRGINGGKLIWVMVVGLLCFVTSESAPESALVTQLPGFTGTFPSKHYSG